RKAGRSSGTGGGLAGPSPAPCAPERPTHRGEKKTHRRGDGDSPSGKRRLAVVRMETRRQGRGDSGSCGGRRTVTDRPPPTTGRAATAPPCASTTALTIERPNPEPRAAPVRSTGPRRNGSNSSSTRSGATSG